MLNTDKIVSFTGYDSRINRLKKKIVPISWYEFGIYR